MHNKTAKRKLTTEGTEHTEERKVVCKKALNFEISLGLFVFNILFYSENYIAAAKRAP